MDIQIKFGGLTLLDPSEEAEISYNNSKIMCYHLI